MRARRLPLTVAAMPLLFATACASPDPAKELKVQDVETYWVIQSRAGDETYICPAVRLRVVNAGSRSWRTVYLSAAFRLVGRKDEWGTGWARVPAPGKVFKPGEQALIVMVAEEGRYHSTGLPESMFNHAQFVDARVEVYAQMAGSKQTRLLEARIERRIGARSVQEYYQ